MTLRIPRRSFRVSIPRQLRFKQARADRAWPRPISKAKKPPFLTKSGAPAASRAMNSIPAGPATRARLGSDSRTSGSSPPFGFGHVGRIADESVDPAGQGIPPQRGEQVSGEKFDVHRPVALGVRPGHVQGPPADVRGDDAGRTKFLGQGDGHGAAARSDFDDRNVIALDFFQDGFHEKFGFRARNENSRDDLKGHGPEFAFPDDVGQWDARRPPRDGPAETARVGRADRPLRIGQDFEFGQAQRSAEKDSRF